MLQCIDSNQNAECFIVLSKNLKSDHSCGAINKNIHKNLDLELQLHRQKPQKIMSYVTEYTRYHTTGGVTNL